MNNPSKDIGTIDPAKGDADEISVLDLLVVLAKHKLLIAGMTSSVAVLAVIVSLLLSNVYTGVARIMPPQQSQSTAAMLLGQGGLAGMAANSLGIKSPNDMYVGMLKSRTVADNIIGRFQLQNLYQRDTMVETRRVLANNTTIVAGKDGLIAVEFDDEDPQRAADVANAYVEELQKLTLSLAITEAAQRRLFFERQLRQTKEDLSEAEVAMKVMQERTGLIKLDDQGRAIIEAVAALRGQIAAKEVELRAMRAFATEQNSEYVRAQQQLVGLRAELTKLERAQVAGGGDILLPTGKVPEAGLDYLRKFREVKYHETIFELLAKQFEIAKIDEAKEAAVIQVLDQAIAPDRKSKPKRALIVIVFTLIAAVASVLLAFVREAYERAGQNPEQAARLAALRRYISIGRRPSAS